MAKKTKKNRSAENNNKETTTEQVEQGMSGVTITEAAPTYESLVASDALNGKYSNVACLEEDGDIESGSCTPKLEDHSIEEFLLEIPSSARYNEVDSKLAPPDSGDKARPNDGLCPVKFRWLQSAREVCVVMSSDWEVQYRMKRLQDGSFEFRHRFEPFVLVQFKFVVDGHWRSSPDYPSLTQGAVTNNYLVPALIEWTGSQRGVSVAFKHQCKGPVEQSTNKHKLRYAKGERWVFEAALGHVGTYRFKFLVDGEWQTSPNYPEQDGLNIVPMALPKGHEATVYTGTADQAPPQAEPRPVAAEPVPAENPKTVASVPEPVAQPPKVDEQKPQPAPEPVVETPPTPTPATTAATEPDPSLEGTAEVTLVWPDASPSTVELRFNTDGWTVPHHARKDGDRYVFTGRFPAFQVLQFKFVVDGTWCISPTYYPFVDPSGNTNNFVVPVALKWEGAGQNVALKSSCDKWSVAVPAKHENGLQVVHLTVPHTGKHEFKFVVDNVWCTAPNYPVTSDGSGNQNNFFEC